MAGSKGSFTTQACQSLCTLLKGQRMDQLMSHLSSSIASIWFTSLNRGPSILERPMDELTHSILAVFPHPFPKPCCCPNPPYVVVPEAPPAAPVGEMLFLDCSKETKSFLCKQTCFFFGYDPPNCSSPHCWGSAWRRVAPQNVPMVHPLSWSFFKKFFPKPSSTTLMESATFCKSKNKLCCYACSFSIDCRCLC